MFKKINPKVKILIALLSIISIISIVWILQKTNTKKTVATATPVPIKFEFVKAIPKSNSTSTIPVTSSIEFYFSKPVDESSASVVISPNIPLSFSSNEATKSFYIRAVPAWKLNQEYTVKIRIKSKDGDTLQNEISYKFKLEQMTNSLLTE